MALIHYQREEVGFREHSDQYFSHTLCAALQNEPLMDNSNPHKSSLSKNRIHLFKYRSGNSAFD
jgi:hypothetical protein